MLGANRTIAGLSRFVIHNTVRSHEALDFRRPLEIYLEEPHIFWGECPKSLTRDTY
jgi:hypothetical protein